MAPYSSSSSEMRKFKRSVTSLFFTFETLSSSASDWSAELTAFLFFSAETTEKNKHGKMHKTNKSPNKNRETVEENFIMAELKKSLTDNFNLIFGSKWLQIPI